jgi:hypothetical protein
MAGPWPGRGDQDRDSVARRDRWRGAPCASRWYVSNPWEVSRGTSALATSRSRVWSKLPAARSGAPAQARSRAPKNQCRSAAMRGFAS